MSLALKFAYIGVIGVLQLAALGWVVKTRDVSDVYEAYYIDGRTLEWAGETGLDLAAGETVRLGGEGETQRDLAKLTGGWGYQNSQGAWSIETRGRLVLRNGGGFLIRPTDPAEAPAASRSLAFSGDADAKGALSVTVNGCAAGRIEAADTGRFEAMLEMPDACLHPGALVEIGLQPDPGAEIRIRTFSVVAG